MKDDRLAQVQALLRRQQDEFAAAQIGRTLPVLIERPGRHDGQVVGRSPYLQGVHLRAPVSAIGSVIPVTIEGVRPNSLAGRRASMVAQSGSPAIDAPERMAV